MNKYKLAFLTVALAASSIAMAQDKAALVKQLLDVQRPAVEGMARLLVNDSVAPILQAGGEYLQTQVPADKREALGKAGLHPRVTDDKSQNLAQASVHEVEVMFEAEIISEIEFADSCGIAAAAEIFQEERVIKVAQRIIVEADLATNMRTNIAASDAMTFRLPFRHIERFAQRLDNLRQANPNTSHHVPLLEI